MDYITAWQDELLMARAEEKRAETVYRAEKSDAQLVELVRAGDEAAFADLFERYKRLVASVAARYFNRPDEVEEIIQISFTKIYFEIERYRGGHDFSLPSWIGRIAANACCDRLRERRRKPENLECELSEAETAALFADSQAEKINAENNLVARDLAEKLLARLAREDRALLEMLEVEEMTVEEVARLTGWSKSKIKVRAFRARRALRKILRKFM